MIVERSESLLSLRSVQCAKISLMEAVLYVLYGL